MKKTNQIIEYLSPCLVLSYFIIHKIIFVLLGIIFSIYLININSINHLIRSINKNLMIKKITKDPSNIDKVKNINSIKIQPSEVDTLTLVEKIEEFGFIPSIDKNNDINTAWFDL